MKVASYEVEFQGYWLDHGVPGIPAESGVYCVYPCTPKPGEGRLRIHGLIYIGEAGDVRSRIAGHEKRKAWESYLQPGDQLCYNFGAVEASDRERVEAAYIFRHVPPENEEHLQSFPYPPTRVRSTGATAEILEAFSVA